MLSPKSILSPAEIESKLRRMALQIIENNWNEPEVVLLGISGPGVVVTQHIQKYMEEYAKIPTTVSTISLNKVKPEKINIAHNIDYTNKVVIIIDDVLNSGKTILYALKPLLESYPKKIQTLVLICRNHNSFPVTPDYIGLDVSTTLQESILVETKDGGFTGAYLL